MKQNSDIAFYIRGLRYGEIEGRFRNKELVRKNSTKPIEATKWITLPFLPRQTMVRLRVGRVYPEIDPEWVAATVLYGSGANKDNVRHKTTIAKLVGIWTGIVDQ